MEHTNITIKAERYAKLFTKRSYCFNHQGYPEEGFGRTLPDKGKDNP